MRMPRARKEAEPPTSSLATPHSIAFECTGPAILPLFRVAMVASVFLSVDVFPRHRSTLCNVGSDPRLIRQKCASARKRRPSRHRSIPYHKEFMS